MDFSISYDRLSEIQVGDPESGPVWISLER